VTHRDLIEADSGGSNGARSRRYKKRLQEFADETGLESQRASAAMSGTSFEVDTQTWPALRWGL